MTVYVDVLIVINIYITRFTVRAAAALLHTELSPKRAAAASVFGGLCAPAALLTGSFWLSVFMKTLFTVVTVLLAFGFGSMKKLAVRSFLCAAAGMLILGAAELIHETGADIVQTANGYVYLDISALVLVAASALIYGVLTVIRRIMYSPEGTEKVRLTIKAGESTAVLSALPDSGNFLRDFLTGKPVILCRRGALEPVLPPNVRCYLSGSTDEVSGIRLIPLSTAAGSAVVPAFRADAVTAALRGEEKRLDVLLAPAPETMENEDFDALVSAKLLL